MAVPPENICAVQEQFCLTGTLLSSSSVPVKCENVFVRPLTLTVDARELAMIRFRIRELMSNKSFLEGRHLTFEELSAATGINRSSLSKMANQRGYNTTTDNLDRLCRYFRVGLNELAQYVDDSDLLKP